MSPSTTEETPDYLVVGHVSADQDVEGFRLGGSAAYSSLTARAFGRRVAVVTAAAADLDLSPLSSLAVRVVPSMATTTFENIETPSGRQQVLHARAGDLSEDSVPDAWRGAAIVHLAPIADEIDPSIAPRFPGVFLGLTVQGWLRSWGSDGKIVPAEPERARQACLSAYAAVASLEDLGGREDWVRGLADSCRIFALTLGARGVRVFDRGQEVVLPGDETAVRDTTGAGDIFAAAFFIALQAHGDPTLAARAAMRLASASISRVGLAAVPSPEEAASALLAVP